MSLHEPLVNESDSTSVEITFKDLKYVVNRGKQSSEEILKGLTGFIPGAKLTAIFGPTGAGKTSLLDVCARRKRLDWVEGEINVNGQPQVSSFKRMSGYVVQDDTLVGMMTVRENILFSARLRLPDNMYRDEDRERVVDDILMQLGLIKCKDTLIGNQLMRGVSGGERKRTSIGCELVTRPSILFLDEPTSGLDAATSVQVVQLIKKLIERENTTVAISIHQPRYSIFKLLEHIILLSDGNIVYQGDPFAVIDYFGACGYICEANDNPGDFMFDALAGVIVKRGTRRANIEDLLNVEDEYHDLASGFPNANAKLAHAILLAAYERSQGHEEAQRRVREAKAAAFSFSPNSARRNDVQGRARYGVNSLKQFRVICDRYILTIKRMPIIIIAQTVVTAIFALVIGGVYWKLDSSFQGLQNRVGAIFFMIMSEFQRRPVRQANPTASTGMIFSNLSALELLISERALFLHQRSAGYYSTGPYFLASVLLDLLPLRVFPTIVFGSVVYPCMGFQAEWENFFYFQAILVMTAVASGALCYLLSALIGIFAVANLVVSMCYVFMMLFGGLLLNLDQLPAFLHWLKYLSLFKLGYNGLAVNELHGLEFKIAPFVKISGDQYLEQQGFQLEDRPKVVAWLAVSATIYLILGYVALRRLKKE